MSAAPSAAEAVASIAARDPRLPELTALLDPRAREAMLGAHEVLQVRWKPGALLVLAVRDARGEAGWVATHADPAKLEKTALRAAAAGAAVERPTPRTMRGPVRADRALARPLRRLAARGRLDLDAAGVLRYNPLRRLVAVHDDRVVRVGAGPRDHELRAAAAAREAGAPVLPHERLGPTAVATPRWGSGDLAHLDGVDAAHAAGAALAALHRGRPDAPPLEPGVVAARAAEGVAALLPELATRARALAGALLPRLGGAAPVLSHGDWSPDQVLVDGGAVRIVDLDRACVAPPERDLGAWLASGGSPAMLEGCASAGGGWHERALPAWRALAALERAAEPFRRGDEHWPASVAARLASAEEALA